MSDSAVLYDVEDHVATITLNRPENRNSMTPDVLSGLSDAVSQARTDADVRCVVLTGNGKSFCAGADFKSRPPGLGGGKGPGGGDDAALPQSPYRAPNELLYETYSHFLSITDIEVPVVAAMQGHAIGGGLGLAVVCDLRVANKDAKYGANFVRLGLHPGMGTTYLLPRLMGVPRAIEFLLTGRIVTGEEAAEAGLVHYAVGEEDVLPRARELAREIATAAPLAVRWTKRSIYAGLDWDPRTAAQREAHVQSRTSETADSREGIKALLERRDPDFQGR